MPDDRRPVTRLFDAVFRFLLRPGVRRVRRWSFLVTVPAGLLVARALDLKISLGTGLGAGLALAALDLLALVVVGALGARLLGKERRDALLDLMMHPAARRAIRGEALVLSTPLRALARRLRPVTRRTEFSYHRGSNELGLALALLPAALAEAAAVHLLLPHEWLVPKIVLAALSLYGFLMLFGWALSSRVDRHRLEGGLLELRAGALYRASVPLRHVETVERASERVARGGLVRHGEAALLPSRGRHSIPRKMRNGAGRRAPPPGRARVRRTAARRPDPCARALGGGGRPRWVRRRRRGGTGDLPGHDARAPALGARLARAR